MVVTLAPHADLARVRGELAARGLWAQPLVGAAAGPGAPPRQLLVAPHSRAVAPESLLEIEGVAAVAAPRSERPRLDAQPAVVRIGTVELGAGRPPAVFAGPCSVESAEHARDAAGRLAALGVRFLRGGAFKPRTSPYAFQGHGAPALRWLRDAADAAGLHVVTEAMAPEDVRAVAEVADLIQVGSRNMHASPLLAAVGRAGKPVLLKRGMAATVEEWLLAAEYCLHHGAPAVILCERGIRGFDPTTRNLLDLGAVALLAHVHRLPVVVDPSHGTGRRDLLAPLARAAVAAGAAGLMLEVHDDPARALSDGAQALRTDELADLLATLEGPHA